MRKFKIIFSPEALVDLKEAKKWYNLQQKGLGEKLVEDVRNATAATKKNPYHASEKYNFVRMASCKIFPYALHYVIDVEQLLVRVTAVFHFSRKPFWMEE